MSLTLNVSHANLTTPVFGPSPCYGSFSSTQIQGIAVGVPTPATYDTVDIEPVGVALSSPSSIRIGVAGVYRVLSSIQVNKTTGGFAELEMFPQVNLTPVPNSGTRVEVNQNAEIPMTVEWFLDLNVGDEVFIQIYTPAAGLELLAVPAAVGLPAIPSIITTIQRIA